MTQALSGIINLNKPAGMSSARVVAVVKRMLPRGIKIGHAGTLDPFATGVLLLLIGKATRQCERLMDQPKQYEATVILGATTPTDDPESAVTPIPRARPASRQEIDAALKGFVGPILQRPPTFSALKIDGRRAYELAREGREVVPEPRTIVIYAIDLLEYQWPRVVLRIDCGRGTYIRAIARDLGEKLGVGGYLGALVRTRVGTFLLSDSTTLDELSRRAIDSCLLPFEK